MRISNLFTNLMTIGCSVRTMLALFLVTIAGCMNPTPYTYPAPRTSSASRTQSDAFAYLLEGNAKAVKRDYNGAMADYNKAIEVDPTNWFAYGLRGNAKKAIGDLDGALADSTKTIELRPDDAIAYY